MKKIAIYTAIFGNYDDLLPPVHAEKLKDQANFYCFTDNHSLKSDIFNVKYVTRPHPDPVKSNRYFKILSHKVLCDYDYVLYVDANVLITCDDLGPIFKKYLKDNFIAAFKHSARNCLYEEAQWVLSRPDIDNPETVRRQVKNYKKEDFPENFGLIAGTFLLRKNNEIKVQYFNELWWNEVLNGSRRDQLSFDYIRWKTKMSVEYMTGDWQKNFIGIRNAHKGSIPKVNKLINMKNEVSLFPKAFQFLKLIIPNKLKYKLKYLSDPTFRNYIDKTKEITRIKSIPNDLIFETSLFGKSVKANHRGSFLFLYKELFEQEIYNFYPKTSNPYIIDCGANIGMSIIYFKMKFPNSRILGFEPDEELYNLSIHNINSLEFNNVEIIKKGLWNEDGKIRFFSEGVDAGRIAKTNDLVNIKEIETVKLSDYLDEKVDFLKIDIEGAEVKVLEECSKQLHNVDKMFIEYHSFIEEEQELSRLIKILEDGNFRYNISTPKVLNKKPYLLDSNYLGMDFLLNIYAYRRK